MATSTALAYVSGVALVVAALSVIALFPAVPRARH